MSNVLFECRQVLRTIVRSPTFFVVASLTLAIGFAAHLSAFALVDRLLLAGPAHVQEPDRLFRLHIDREDRGSRFLWFQTPYRTYQDLRDASLFDGMASYRTTTVSAGTGDQARQLSVVFADEDYFRLLGVSPHLGRFFSADENRPPSGTPVLVISYQHWQSAFAGDPSIIGSTYRVGTVTYTIVGVTPKGFTGDTLNAVDAWAPLFAGAYELNPAWTTGLLFRSVTVLARLRPGISQAAVAAQTADVYRRLVDGTEAADPTAQVVLASLMVGRAQRGELTQSGRIAVWIEIVAVLVLIVALANVVNLQMSRGVQMRREIAVRVALGAGRARLALRLFMEMLVMAAVACIAGVSLAIWSATALQQLLMPGAPPPQDVWRVVAAGLLTALVTAIVCAGVITIQIRTTDVAERLKSGRGGDGFRRERVRQALLVAQVVVSTLLLVGAGLFLRSIDRLGRLQFGHDHDRVLTVTIPFRSGGYAPQAVEQFFVRAQEELRALPGVDGVAAAQTMPFSPSQSADMFVRGMDTLPFDGRPYPTFYTVTPDFFRTMGMTVLRGRGFTREDRDGAPRVMVVEEALARALWPDGDAIGQCVALNEATAPCREVVGVVSNTRRFVGTREGSLRYYIPLEQRLYAATPQALFVRTAGEPAAAIPSVRQALLGVDANLPFMQIRTLGEMSEPEKRPWRLGTLLFVLFGAAALLVATAGVYALLSFMVTQRSREIGVRLALGATPSDALRLVLRQSQGWILIGLVIGFGVAALAGPHIEPALFETSPFDPVVYVATAVVLLVVAVLAGVAPALRASRVDPNIALRVE